MTQGNQQQGQQQQAQQQQAQEGQQQQANPLQVLGRALTDIRRVQNFLELNHPDEGEAIQLQREAGDLVWNEVQRMQQQQQGQQ